MNKKVIGTTKVTIDNINFKSKIESRVYDILKNEGFNPRYEEVKFILWEGFKPTVPFYGRNNRLINKKLINITYTPDFTFYYKNKFIIIEVKGKETDVFPYKFKMFRGILENPPYKGNTLLFEIFTLGQLKECINIIKNEIT
ncbi:MAG: DUF1064 domain-containing protein [Clostridium sp.]